MSSSNPVAALLGHLLASTPGLQAAMKAGRKTSISLRVYRAAEDRWEDYGVVSSSEGSWKAVFGRLVALPQVVIRFRLKGKEYERS